MIIDTEYALSKYLSQMLIIDMPCDTCDEKASWILEGKSGAIGVCKKCPAWWQKATRKDDR
jgi:hypothetical protein